MPLEDAKRFQSQLADAVAYCHTQGVAHRDLKPENIALDALGIDIKLLDFGCSVQACGLCPPGVPSWLMLGVHPGARSAGALQGSPMAAQSLGIVQGFARTCDLKALTSARKRLIGCGLCEDDGFCVASRFGPAIFGFPKSACTPGGKPESRTIFAGMISARFPGTLWGLLGISTLWLLALKAIARVSGVVFVSRGHSWGRVAL